MLNHFKDLLFQALPTSIPFSCPECQVPHRDKITLLRHYAWKHNMIYKFASKEDLKPRPIDQPIRDPESATPESNWDSKFAKSDLMKIVKAEGEENNEQYDMEYKSEGEEKVENGEKKTHKCSCGKLFFNVSRISYLYTPNLYCTSTFVLVFMGRNDSKPRSRAKYLMALFA